MVSSARVLNPGTRLDTYEITSQIGEGGMGEVYRARDASLNRDVAIKVLRSLIANDPDRLARFKREAQALASLNHPHIAQIFGLERSDALSSAFIVMEFVDGEELAERIRRGPLPIDVALPIARQIAEALEGAHEQGIIHRDLKPANIKIKPDGTVKVLDFGLAKASDPAMSSSASLMNSPTLSMHATAAGIILGTAAYMSPEQARGRAVDKRADLWAFGCVLFEMLTGQRAFGGDDVTDTIVAVVSKDPNWQALPASTPLGIRRLLAHCLEKDPKKRLDSAAAARIEIDEAIAPGTATSLVVEPVAASRPFPWSQAIAWTMAVVAIGVAGWESRSRAGSTAPTAVYASIDAPPGFVLGEDDAIVPLPTRNPLAFTPDGRSIVVQAAKAGKPQLFLRSLDSPDARPIAGTEDARVPFVSPDGKWVGFWTANELKKVPIDGGTPTTICPVPAILGPYGATWGSGDVIVYADNESRRLFRVSSNGGTPVAISEHPPAQRRHIEPWFLPDGKRVLFSDASIMNAGDVRLMVQSIDGGSPVLVQALATHGRALPNGRLAFLRVGTLLTAPFDAATATTRGEPVAAMGSVMQSGIRGRFDADVGGGMLDVSSTGTLAAIRGPLTGSVLTPLAWVDRQSHVTPAAPAQGAPHGGTVWARISPDQSRIIVAIQTPMKRETWIVDRTRDVWTPCNNCADDFGSVAWSHDGRHMAATHDAGLSIHTVDASAPDEELVHEDNRLLLVAQWLPDGRIIYLSGDGATKFEIKVLEPGSHTGRTIVPMGVGNDPNVSPDARWLAYVTPQNGDDVVMVQAFPGPGPRMQVSAGAGTNPAWSADGRTLYYIGRGTSNRSETIMMAVDVRSGDTFEAGKPHELFRRAESQRCGIMRCYDVSADGSRFLFSDKASSVRETVSRFDLILNWTATLPH